MDTIQQIQISMEDCKAAIELKDALARLEANPDFKKLINVAYMEKHSAAAVSRMAAPMNDSEEKRIKNVLIGVSSLQAFFRAVHSKGVDMESALVEHEAAINEIEAEGN